MASERLIAKNKTYLNINTSLTDVDTITKTIADDLSYVELRRADTSATGVFASYLCKIDNTSQFDNISKKLKSMDNDVKISMIDQPEVLS
jgi:hypothetical protein